MMLEMIDTRLEMSTQMAEHAHEMARVNSLQDQVIAGLKTEHDQAITQLKDEILKLG